MINVRQLVTAARAGIENLTADELAHELATGDPLVVDVRELGESADGVVVGALRCPRGVLEFYADAGAGGFDRGRRVITCSESGARSALAAATLQELGYDDVGHLDGGLRAWAASGRETVRPQPVATTAARPPLSRPGPAGGPASHP
jgi:rhodanese-related sulfurtransferase